MTDAPGPTGTDAPLPSSWDVEDAEVANRPRRWGLVVGGVVLALLVVGGTIAFVANRGGEEQRAWPDLGGRPAGLGAEGDTAATVTNPTAEPGVYLWNSFDGWHLWVVNGDKVKGVHGTIESTDDIGKATASSPESGTVEVKGKTATFDLSGTPKVAGLDFEPGFYSKRITVSLQGPDGPIPASLVVLGAKGHPDAVPVVIDKPLVSDASTTTTGG